MSKNLVIDCATGQTTFTPLTPEQAAANVPTQSSYAREIQRHIDATAQSREYADGFALASYVNSTVPAWAAEATTFVAWRDQVWVYAYAELEKVKSGARQQPAIKELIDELPEIIWPSENNT